MRQELRRKDAAFQKKNLKRKKDQKSNPKKQRKDQVWDSSRIRYGRGEKILLVGEGNFSFTQALTKVRLISRADV